MHTSKGGRGGEGREGERARLNWEDDGRPRGGREGGGGVGGGAQPRWREEGEHGGAGVALEAIALSWSRSVNGWL
jgi:hypothetical protein